MTAPLDAPGRLARLQARPELIPHAVLELLRYDGPNQFVRRVADHVVGPRDAAQRGRRTTGLVSPARPAAPASRGGRPLR